MKIVYAFFHKQKHNFEEKKFYSFFGCKLLCSNMFYEKKILHPKFDFLCL